MPDYRVCDSGKKSVVKLTGFSTNLGVYNGTPALTVGGTGQKVCSLDRIKGTERRQAYSCLSCCPTLKPVDYELKTP